MQSSDEIEIRLREMIRNLDDDDCANQLEEILEAMAKRDHQISQTLEDLLAEVDQLILLADELEDDEECAR